MRDPVTSAEVDHNEHIQVSLRLDPLLRRHLRLVEPSNNRHSLCLHFQSELEK